MPWPIGAGRSCAGRPCRGAAVVRPDMVAAASAGHGLAYGWPRRRRDRGRRSDRRCHGRNGGGMGRRSTGAGHVLVLHRSFPHAGVLGLCQ